MQNPTPAASQSPREPEARKDHGELISFVGLFLALATANIALLATQLTYL
jgi:hypothetical protein